MRVSCEVRLSAPAIGHVRVQLRRGEVGVAEHLLDAPEIRSPLEQMRRERVAEEMWMNPPRLEACFLGEALEDEEGAGARQWASLRIQEELRAVTAVEKRAAAGLIPAEGVHGAPA
jgi:hypothetical protein